MSGAGLQVVKSDTATVFLPELEFEIPAATQRGTITTLDGLLGDAAENLRALQPERHRAQPETAAAIDAFLAKLDKCVSGQQDFQLVLEDPAGNSYLESPNGDVQSDTALQVEYYERTRQQAEAVGLSVPDADQVSLPALLLLTSACAGCLACGIGGAAAGRRTCCQARSGAIHDGEDMNAVTIITCLAWRAYRRSQMLILPAWLTLTALQCAFASSECRTS